MKKNWNFKTGSIYSLLLLFLFTINSAAVVAQTKTITGIVRDAEGQTVPGATITVKGIAGIGTTTDMDGKYSLALKELKNVTLVYSFIGLKAEEIKLSTQTVINVTLTSDAKLLEDVVIVGYGTQKKETVVGSITQTKGTELLKAGSVTTVSEALTGLLPGVSTMQAAGQPGSTAATILIRGQSSWNNNNPLFVVDGIERDFNDLDPNEIEGISVLKDASATAVYGVKAANGVILVTTKRGNIGAPKVSFTGSWGVKVPVINTDYFVPYDKNLEYYNQAVKNDGVYNLFRTQGEINTWADPNRDKDFYTYTNWVNTMIGNGETSTYNVNVSGGNDFVTYFTSFGYNYDGDMFKLQKQPDFDPRTWQRRYNWRSNLDFKFTKSTKVKINLSGDFKDWSGNRVTFAARNGIGNAVGGDSQYLKTMYNNVMVGTPPILSDGRLGAGNNALDWFKMNYLGEMEREGQSKERSNRIYSDFILEQKIFKDFLFKVALSYNFSRAYQSEITASPLYFQADPSNGTFVQYGGDPDAVAGLIGYVPENLTSYGNSLYYEASLLYNKSIKSTHNISALGLFSRRKARNQVSFPAFEESWVGRATYDYKKTYLIEFNGAYNGSEKFGPGKRFGFFPSIATGWVLSEESFFKNNISFINFMKLRYSWGQIGSDMGASRFTYLSNYNQSLPGYGNGGTSRNGHPGGYGNIFTLMGNQGYLYYEGKPANPDATWETSTKQDLGLEMTFLGGKLTTTFDLFNERRTGILMTRRTIPAYYGNVFPDANIGETKNHGFDFEIKFNKRVNKDLQYNISSNFSVSENRIVERDDPFLTPEYQKQAGKPIGWSAGYISNGLMGSWDDVFNNTQPTAARIIPGDFSFYDYNADGVINQLDQAPIGRPSYAAKTFALNTGITYKAFTFTAMFNGMVDISKQLSSNYLWEYFAAGGLNFSMLDTEMLDYWTPENLGASHPALHINNNGYNSNPSAYTTRRSDYLRLRVIELKYNVNSKSISWLRFMSNLEIYLNANNMFTWSRLPKEFDPEAAQLEVYPIAKRYNLGVRFSL